jgi:hypothetical protein
LGDTKLRVSLIDAADVDAAGADDADGNDDDHVPRQNCL